MKTYLCLKVHRIELKVKETNLIFLRWIKKRNNSYKNVK
jgi:hypothetical protein